MSATEGATPDSSATPDTPVAPATGGQRLGSLDLIRGFAVLGILAANIVAFGQPFSAYMWPDAFLSGHDATSDWLWVAQLVAVDGKMRGLFTLLFGAGMALFMDKAWERGATRWLQVRRLFWLMVFGLVHFYLIWRGDILVLYSLSGFIALLFVRWQARNLLITGFMLYLLGSLMIGVGMGLPHAVADTSFGTSPEMAEVAVELEEAKAEELADDTVETGILTEGSWIDFVSHNAEEHGSEPFTSNIMAVFFETLPMMLIGMGFYRLGLFSGGFTASKQRMWGWIGVISGSLLTLAIALAVKSGGLTYWGTVAAISGYTQLPRLPVVLGLACLLSLWGAHAEGWLAERLSAAGRAAFTNYLGTSVLMMLIFHPWAGGLWGELTRPELYLVVALGWAVMLLWSKPWLEKYRYGPLEWLWRCLTYWRIFPLKR